MRILVVAALTLASVSALAQVPISTLPAAGNIVGTEDVPLVQSGLTSKSTPDALGVYINQMLKTTVQNLVIPSDGPKARLSKYITGSGHTDAPTVLGVESNYLLIGGREYGDNSYRCIGFGYALQSFTNQPACIGYQETEPGGETYGDLIFATRSVDTDTPPDVRMRITSVGAIGVGSDGVGTAGEVLTSAGAGAPPTWEPAGGGGGVVQTTGTFAINWTDACTTTPVMDIRWVATGNVVTWRIDDTVVCTGDSVNFLSTADVPAPIRPIVQTETGFFTISNAGTAGVGCLVINTNGTVQVRYSTAVAGMPCGNAANTWTASGTRVLGGPGGGTMIATYLLN